MTPVIIGTYRKHKHIETCLRSLETNLHGISELIFIDDSGDPNYSTWLTQHGKVIETGGQGYTAAMTAACQAANNRQAFWLEEDFTFKRKTHLDQLTEILYHRPYLAQIALLRGPHFPVEHTHGGLIEALQGQGHQFTTVAGVIEHTATFTANPSLWRAEVWAAGWPNTQWSETTKRNQLLAQGYRFGFLPGIRVTHHGTRDGHGY